MVFPQIPIPVIQGNFSPGAQQGLAQNRPGETFGAGLGGLLAGVGAGVARRGQRKDRLAKEERDRTERTDRFETAQGTRIAERFQIDPNMALKVIRGELSLDEALGEDQTRNVLQQENLGNVEAIERLKQKFRREDRQEISDENLDTLRSRLGLQTDELRFRTETKLRDEAQGLRNVLESLGLDEDEITKRIDTFIGSKVDTSLSQTPDLEFFVNEFGDQAPAAMAEFLKAMEDNVLSPDEVKRLSRFKTLGQTRTETSKVQADTAKAREARLRENQTQVLDFRKKAQDLREEAQALRKLQAQAKEAKDKTDADRKRQEFERRVQGQIADIVKFVASVRTDRRAEEFSPADLTALENSLAALRKLLPEDE